MHTITESLDHVAGGYMPVDGSQTDLPPSAPPLTTDPLPPFRRTNG